MTLTMTLTTDAVVNCRRRRFTLR